MLEKSNAVNFVNSPISLGIVEANELPSKSNAVNCVNSPISVGIVEVNALLSKFKYVNCVNTPISLGIAEPVVALSNVNVDRHFVTFAMERKLHAIITVVGMTDTLPVGARVESVVGAATGEVVAAVGLVGMVVGEDIDEELAVADDRTTSKTTATIAPTRQLTNKAIPKEVH